MSQTNLGLSDLEFLDLVSMDKYILVELTVLHEVDLTNSGALRAVEYTVWSTSQCGVSQCGVHRQKTKCLGQRVAAEPFSADDLSRRSGRHNKSCPASFNVSCM